MKNKWEAPKDVTYLDLAFGPSNLSDYLPTVGEIPKELNNWNHPWQEFISRWFFSGLPVEEFPTPKEGIDAKKAKAHVCCVLRSFEPKHEHKTAGCAYLMSLWFELPKPKKG